MGKNKKSRNDKGEDATCGRRPCQAIEACTAATKAAVTVHSRDVGALGRALANLTTSRSAPDAASGTCGSAPRISCSSSGKCCIVQCQEKARCSRDATNLALEKTLGRQLPKGRRKLEAALSQMGGRTSARALAMAGGIAEMALWTVPLQVRTAHRRRPAVFK